ncbi:MAG: sensor histidine kinase [Actinomycetota bacterium]|nr:sensor histidine kinase [Actinomycetota bacterium]
MPDSLHLRPHDDFVGRWAEPTIFAMITLMAAARAVIEGADLWVLVAAAVALAGLMWGRRRAPIVGGAIATGAAIVGLAFESTAEPSTGILAAAAVYVVTVQGPRRRARLAAAILAGTFLGGLVLFGGLTFQDLFRNMALLLLGFASGEAVWYRRSVLVEARERVRLAEVTRDEEARLRVQEERLRIARELHDIVGHSLSIINVQAGVAAHVIDEQPEVAGTALEEIRKVSHNALEELRATVGVLRTGMEDATELAPTPGLKDLGKLIDSFRDAGLSVDVYMPEVIPALGAAQQLAIYRVVQEALTNVVRHANSAKTEVSVVFPQGEVSVEISNDGDAVGQGEESSGQGLVGMRERVGALGGSVSAEPRAEGGFRIRARFPVRQP